MTERNSKSRDLPLSEYYSVLQREFICYYLRSKIYPEPYRDKYVRFCVAKKEKIETIGLKNALPSIFSNESKKQKYIDSVINKNGLPNFEYRDEKSVEVMGYYDKVYWFSKGTTVRITHGGDPTTAIVKVNLPKLDKVIIKLGVLEVEFNYNEISRIITKSLTDF